MHLLDMSDNCKAMQYISKIKHLYDNQVILIVLIIIIIINVIYLFLLVSFCLFSWRVELIMNY